VLKEGLYSHYLSIRKEYLNTPSFFVEVADLFYKNGIPDTAKMILSNIVEISNQNEQIIQEYGNKLIEFAQYKDAVPAFKFITELREEFPQSYRDYALSCELAGNYQEAYDVMLSILSKSWPRFDNIKIVVYTEFNELIANHKDQIILHDFDPKLYAPMPMKLRVVLTWNTDNCDIDLHVMEPDGVKCFYSHRFTQLGGRLSFDYTQGFGPEEYLMKNKVDGIYQIFAQYYGSTSQAQLLPVIVYADIYTDYGTSSQTHKRLSLKLKQKNDTYEIGIVEIEPEPEK
jgi:tetratricopeptide (TPR) repeat protein